MAEYRAVRQMKRPGKYAAVLTVLVIAGLGQPAALNV